MRSLIFAGLITFAGAVTANASVFDLSFAGTGITGSLRSLARHRNVALRGQWRECWIGDC